MRSRPSDICFNVQGLREKVEEVYGGNLAELARVSDVPGGTLYAIINRGSMPHLDIAVKIADALNVDLAFLVERTGNARN